MGDQDLRITRFLPRHVPAFLAMAEREGWICDRWEFDFLSASFPRGGHVAWSDGQPVAFVTAILYERSGWIGNLLVHPGLRGRGLGRKMFNGALAALEGAGAETVWLTASEDGRVLYESVGFLPLDSVIRWRGAGECAPLDVHVPEATLVRVGDLDREGWGDCRSALLRTLAERGSVLADGDGFLMLQRMGTGIHLGPWSCRTPGPAVALLGGAWRHDPSSRHEAFLDSPAGNRFADRLLSRAGFAPCSSTVLMYRGKKPDYRADSVFALASMGSMG
jgi:GNAT superfamily N-acetyltransferase